MTRIEFKTLMREIDSKYSEALEEAESREEETAENTWELQDMIQYWGQKESDFWLIEEDEELDEKPEQVIGTGKRIGVVGFLDYGRVEFRASVTKEQVEAEFQGTIDSYEDDS